MTSKRNILLSIRKNLKCSFDMPSFDNLAPVQYEDRLQQFIAATQMAGGHVVIMDESSEINKIIRAIYPDAAVIASSIPEVKADIDPDMIDDPKQLNGTDLGIIRGEFAVAENGCVWVPQTMKERAVLFMSECLMIIVDKDQIVNNMHEAYSRIHTESYGCFISGPSKTADIAQALVMGAQAARDVTVLIV